MKNKPTPFPNPKDFVGTTAERMDEDPGSPVVIKDRNGVQQIVMSQEAFRELRDHQGLVPKGTPRRLDTVSTVAQLLVIETEYLRTGDLCWVDALDGISPNDQTLPRDLWTGRVIFVEAKKGLTANGDTVFAAPSGGAWIRVRDIA
jgi:hypothetical protein